MKTTWKEIPTVPTSQELLDIVLSRTQRRLPTQIRSGFKISRIRAFYTRKVKFCSENFAEKLQAILDGFPRLQDIHPFHRDLINTLYDADHFRIALGQVSTAKHLIETVSRDYVRLLKYGQSLYQKSTPASFQGQQLLRREGFDYLQCKSLKVSALGRMGTISKRLKDSLTYLEQVRQHLGRIPDINPNTRTLVLWEALPIDCSSWQLTSYSGYPNVGKSSFLRSISRADVDVQSYPFTTRSLFVGHYDFKYLRFQAVDTPGILDHPLEEMTTIEMQSITAIAHLRSAIVYFMDLSEQCGYPVEQQIQLFQSIKPLFANKPVFIVVNKIDIMSLDDVDPTIRVQLNALLTPGEVELLSLSCATTEGVTAVKNSISERLIADRVAQKLKSGSNTSGAVGGRLGEVLSRIHVAQPLGGVLRDTYIPDAVRNRKRFDMDDPLRPRLAREIEEADGGAGVHNVNLREKYILANENWKEDRVPEIFEGRNIADFVDPDIEEKLAALEAEEEKLQEGGFYDSAESTEDDEEEEIRRKAEQIREKQQLIRNENKMRKSLKNRAVMPRSAIKKKLSVMEDKLDELGFDTTNIVDRAREQSRGRSTAITRAVAEDAMDIDQAQSNRDSLMAKARTRSQSNRREAGITTLTARAKAERLARLSQKKMNRMARQGEADRHIASSMPKHLFSGKRSVGKTQRR